MNICVLNGSPRGEWSTTAFTVKYIEKCFPEHSFEYVMAGSRINALEKDPAPAVSAVMRADLVIFSYPVYTFSAPSQLCRFISLLKKSGEDFSGKYMTQITTSKHFYDVTAHRYLEDNAHDMGMKVIHGLSADMEDLTHPKGQRDAENFFKYVQWCVENDIYEKAMLKKARAPKCIEAPEKNTNDIGVSADSEYDTVIVCDLREDDAILCGMIDEFRRVYPYRTRIINIRKFSFAGGCIGCLNCAGDGKCIYKDGFDSLLREKIQNADATVYAFTIEDHSMGSRFKMFDDRQFCNGHRTVTEGMPIGYLINGDLDSEENLRMIIEARGGVGHYYIAGTAASACSDGGKEDIRLMAEKLAYALRESYVPPRNFWGVGGMKIFRDLIWEMRGIMKADHEFYKSHGGYDDMPQKHRGRMMLMCLLGAMIRNPGIKKKMGNKMNEGMAAPYKKVLEQTGPKEQTH